MAACLDEGMAGRTPPRLRGPAAATVDAGVARPKVARAFRVCPRSIERWVAKSRRSEPLADRRRSDRPPKVAPALRPAMMVQAAAHPDATLDEHREGWAVPAGVRVGHSTMAREMARLGLTLKKRP